MRNAVERRPHKERAQPASRQKWGLLEKHKDYSLRAADYNLKKRKLGELSRKAKEKNPDEFAFGMLSAEKAKQGKHGMRGDENRLSHDAVKLLKTQDSGYLRTVLKRESREIVRLEEAVGMDLVDDGAVRMKVVFGEDGLPIKRGKKRRSSGEEVEDETSSEAEVETFVDGTVSYPVLPAGGDDTESPGTTIMRAQPLSKKAQLLQRQKVAELRTERKRRKRMQEIRAAKLEVLKKRQKEIMKAADGLEEQRARMNRSVGGVNKNGVKFKVRERKR